MRTQTVAAVHTVLGPLSTLAAQARRTARRGKSLRLYQTVTVMTEGPALEAVKALLAQGRSVTVYEASRIYTPTLEGETVIWSSRETTKYRPTAVVEVEL